MNDLEAIADIQSGKRTDANAAWWGFASVLLPDLNYRMPDYVLEGTDERLRRVLGKHPEMGV